MDSGRRRRKRWGPEVDEGGATATKHTAPDLPARAPDLGATSTPATQQPAAEPAIHDSLPAGSLHQPPPAQAHYAQLPTPSGAAQNAQPAAVALARAAATAHVASVAERPAAPPNTPADAISITAAAHPSLDTPSNPSSAADYARTPEPATHAATEAGGKASAVSDGVSDRASDGRRQRRRSRWRPEAGTQPAAAAVPIQSNITQPLAELDAPKLTPQRSGHVTHAPNLKHAAPTSAQSSWQGGPSAIGAAQQQKQGVQPPGVHGCPSMEHPATAAQQLQQPLTAPVDVDATRLQEDAPFHFKKRRRQSRFHPEAEEIAAVLALARTVPPPATASASLPGSNASPSHVAANAAAAGQNPSPHRHPQLSIAPSDPCKAARQAAVANAAGQPANVASTVPLAPPPGPATAAAAAGVPATITTA